MLFGPKLSEAVDRNTLVTVIVAVNFFDTIVGVSRGIVPVIAIVPCVLYFFTRITVAAFFWVFNRTQG